MSSLPTQRQTPSNSQFSFPPRFVSVSLGPHANCTGSHQLGFHWNHSTPLDSCWYQLVHGFGLLGLAAGISPPPRLFCLADLPALPLLIHSHIGSHRILHGSLGLFFFFRCDLLLLLPCLASSSFIFVSSSSFLCVSSSVSSGSLLPLLPSFWLPLLLLSSSFLSLFFFLSSFGFFFLPFLSGFFFLLSSAFFLLLSFPGFFFCLPLFGFYSFCGFLFCLRLDDGILTVGSQVPRLLDTKMAWMGEEETWRHHLTHLRRLTAALKTAAGNCLSLLFCPCRHFLLWVQGTKNTASAVFFHQHAEHLVGLYIQDHKPGRNSMVIRSSFQYCRPWF